MSDECKLSKAILAYMCGGDRVPPVHVAKSWAKRAAVLEVRLAVAYNAVEIMAMATGDPSSAERAYADARVILGLEVEPDE